MQPSPRINVSNTACSFPFRSAKGSLLLCDPEPACETRKSASPTEFTETTETFATLLSVGSYPSVRSATHRSSTLSGSCAPMENDTAFPLALPSHTNHVMTLARDWEMTGFCEQSNFGVTSQSPTTISLAFFHEYDCCDGSHRYTGCSGVQTSGR